jgi:hypothetical protein
MHSSLLIFGSLSCPGLTVGSGGLIRPDVADAPKSAIAPAIAGHPLDQQCGIALARAAALPQRYGSEGRALWIGLLFHQLQQGTPALGVLRFGLLRCFHQPLIRQHRIA